MNIKKALFSNHIKNIKDCNIFFSVLENLYVFISGCLVHNAFLEVQKELQPENKPIELKRLCETRGGLHTSLAV